MVQIIDRPESFSSMLAKQLGGGIGSGVSEGMQSLIDRRSTNQENEALKRLTGKDFSGLSPDIRKEFLKIYTGAHSQRAQEKQRMLETGLGTIEQMKGLLESAGGWTSNIGNKLASFVPGSDTQQKRAQLSQLGTSLIPLAAAGVSIRNQKEFDQYKKIIADPDSSPAQMEGALNGLESIISRQLDNPDLQLDDTRARKEALPMFDISNASHKKTRDALMKKYRGDQEKVRKELLKYYREE